MFHLCCLWSSVKLICELINFSYNLLKIVLMPSTYLHHFITHIKMTVPPAILAISVVSTVKVYCKGLYLARSYQAWIDTKQQKNNVYKV
jgi:hypothetical protein